MNSHNVQDTSECVTAAPHTALAEGRARTLTNSSGRGGQQADMFAWGVVRRHQMSWRATQWIRRIGWMIHMRWLRPLPSICKRSMDIVLAAGLGLATLPLALLMAATCRLTGGRCLRATRVVGQYGKAFELYEFAAPERGWGRLARYFGLTQLPVLWHVAKGELAWIGPRPLQEGAPRGTGFQRRAADRPGLICLWWIRQQANIDFDSESDADHEYIESASLRGDLGIAARAIWIRLLGGRRREIEPPTKIRVLDVPIRNVSMETAVEELCDLMESDGPPQQATFVNADCINQTRRDHHYRQLLQDVDWNYADGIGLKIAARLQRAAVRQNVNGTDLFPRLLTRMEESRLGVFLLGGEANVAEDTAAWIRRHHPGVSVCGAFNGYFSAEEAAVRIEQINQSGADLLLVAMGAPRQDLWIRQHLHELEVRVAIGVGGLFDFYSGRKRRAPLWVREMGMEWWYRLMLEPARLWRRYLIGNGAFLARVLWDAITNPTRSSREPLAGDKK